MQEILDRAHPWAITLVLHNWPVLLYSAIAVMATVWALIHPSRATILFLYGAILLALAFEYEKHGTATILDTTRYLFSIEVNGRLRTLSQWLLLDVVPTCMQIGGWVLLLGSPTAGWIQRQHRSVAEMESTRPL